MAYQTGTMKNTQDLVDQLIVLMKTQGWVLDKQTSRYGVTWSYVHHPDTGYFLLETDSDTSLLLGGATGFDDRQSAGLQPGSSDTISVYLGPGSPPSPLVSYDFFVTSRYCHVVIQKGDSRFYHCGFGLLDKEGTYSGGQYVYAGYGDGYFPFDHHTQYSGGSWLRAEIPGETGITSGWYPFRKTSPRAIGPGNPMVNGDHPDLLAMESSQSALGGVLAPVPAALYITTSQNITFRAGVVPDFCVCRMQGLTPRAKVQINGEQWMVVPVHRLTFQRPPSGDNNDTSDWAYTFRISA
ncbi:hypothetical protein PK12_004773 [Salmonella enterica subsp. enterica]|nr:hypothetical protein [Salmonella enterica subsp. enterica serovar Bonariensis]EEA7822529.1 hypothetical protein [Salmonella enterica subsp. enterica serovar Miami]EIY0667516.1 hypothetical protein [Salmonella enterica]